MVSAICWFSSHLVKEIFMGHFLMFEARYSVWLATCFLILINLMFTLMPLQATSRQHGSTAAGDIHQPQGFTLQVMKVNQAIRVISHLALQRVKQWEVIICGWDERSVLPFHLDPVLSVFVNWSSHFAAFFEDVVCWLLNVPATCECVSGTDLHRQFYLLPHWDRSCRSNFPSHPVTVYWHRADQSQCWPYNTRRLAG